MAYFKIGDTDFSPFVKSLKVSRTANYNAQTNAAGNSVVDYINTKRSIEVGFIFMSGADMLALQTAIRAFSVSITFMEPRTNTLEENVLCIVPDDEVEYYTIQQQKTLVNECVLTFTEL